MAKKKISVRATLDTLYPLVAFDDAVIIPLIPQPVKIEDRKIIDFLISSRENKREVFVGWSREKVNDMKPQSLENFGTICRIDKILQMPGAPTMVFFLPLKRGFVEAIKDLPSHSIVEIKELPEIVAPKKQTRDEKALLEHLDNLFLDIMNFLGDQDRQTAELMVNDFSGTLVEKVLAMVQVGPFTLTERYDILACNDFDELLVRAVSLYDTAKQRMELQYSIQERTHNELTRQQKELFLRTHLHHIKEELGEEAAEDDEISQLSAKADEIKWAAEDREHFNKELAKLRRLNINNPEYSVQHAYLETFLSLPWHNYPHKNISLKKVEEVLNRDHYGLEKVKDRIIEQMAVLKLRNDLKAPILCLYGPPGVGKTSIGKSVAEALGREYVRISLGGVHDEAEVRGHRRTYIGAMPGRIMQALTKIKTGNPLMLLDEIDKLGKDYKGDPSSALLEALDPEQNNTFHDNFIDHPYDLSKILFIATANDLSTIPAPLRDRMEIIEMNSYIPEEKREIALRHLIDKALRENGFKEKEITFSPEAVDVIIRYYTREAGVRQLEKKIAKVLRKIARLKASRRKFPTVVTPEIAEEFLGKHETDPENYEVNDMPGVATGLAWTPTGGDILYIETSLSPGKGEKLTLTGNLGDVMKESAAIALQYIKAHAEEIGIEAEKIRNQDVHIHVPEGAIPKDGPSAGIALISSMASAFLGKPLPERLAMTGEITLRGKVMPVGGIKEKIIAAKMAGIKTIVLSEQNRKDIDEIAPQYLEGLEFRYVNKIKEVLNLTLE